MIRFACPGCSATFTVTDEKAGKTGKCPKCQTQFTIPAVPATDPDRPPPPTTVEAPPPIPTVDAPPPVPMQTVEAPPPLPPPIAPPPPVVPPPPGPNDPVEILPCPKCTSRLSVLPGDVGLDVECPNCQTVYRANRADAPPTPVLESSAGRPKSSALVKYGSGAKSRDDDEDDEDDRPSRRRKSRRRDEDDDEDDDRPSRRRRGSRRRSGRSYEPHRGTLILVFGILGFVVSAIFGIVAWVMGAADLKAMDAGRMDPEGRSQTQIGMYLGMASVIISVVVVLGLCVIYCGVLGCFAGGAGAGGPGGGR